MRIMSDYLVRARAMNDQIRAFACSSRDIVEYARAANNMSPTVTAALGRLMTGGIMMGAMQKGDKDVITLQIKGDGPVHGLTVTADAHGHVKGYADVPQAEVTPRPDHKLNVGGVVGQGFLTVIRDMGMKDPYSSRVALQTGEIGDDLTYYFASSEQVPSSVGLGVLMNHDNTVAQAGGFIIQLMPFAEEDTISILETNLGKIRSVTDLLRNGLSPEDILREITQGMDLTIEDKSDISFECDCGRERVERALILIGHKEIRSMIDEDKGAELNCKFCNKSYKFTSDELEKIDEEILKNESKGKKQD